jgi:hypothetical protein
MEDRLLAAFRRMPAVVKKREVEMLELRASIYPRERIACRRVMWASMAGLVCTSTFYHIHALCKCFMPFAI